MSRSLALTTPSSTKASKLTTRCQNSLPESSTGIGWILRIPVLLYGKEFWQRVVNFEALVEEGVVSAKDLDIFTYCETAEEGWECVQRFYQDRSLDIGLAEAEQQAAEEIAAQADTSR